MHSHKDTHTQKSSYLYHSAAFSLVHQCVERQEEVKDPEQMASNVELKCGFAGGALCLL